jgi:hypothetical protein
MKIDNNKVAKLVELQMRANREIDVYGQTDEGTFNDMMEIADSLNAAEQDEFLRLYLEELGSDVTEQLATISK